MKYLDKNKNDKIMGLMSVNLNKNFELDDTSTNIYNNVDKLLDKNKADIDAEIKERIDKIFKKVEEIA